MLLSNGDVPAFLLFMVLLKEARPSMRLFQEKKDKGQDITSSC